MLDNGFTLDTDLVVLTAGGRPSTALARRAGLTVRRGIVVDDRLRLGRRPDDPRDRRLRRARWPDHRVRPAGLGAGRDPGRPPRRRRRRRTTAAAPWPASARPDLDVAVLGDPERTDGEVVEVTNPVARLASQARGPRRRDRRRHAGRRPVPDRAAHPALRPRHRARPAPSPEPCCMGDAARPPVGSARRRGGLRLRRRHRRPDPGLHLPRGRPVLDPRHHRLRRLRRRGPLPARLPHPGRNPQ